MNTKIASEKSRKIAARGVKKHRVDTVRDELQHQTLFCVVGTLFLFSREWLE
jgi:hypothetical protein